MAKKNPEIRLLMKILAAAGFVVLLAILAGYVFLKIKAPHLLELADGVEEIRIELVLDSLPGSRFYQGMTGCENLALEKDGPAMYVSTLDGRIHLLDGPSFDSLSVQKSLHAGTGVMGICILNDSLLAAVINTNPAEEWMTKGAAVFLLNKTLEPIHRISPDFPSANGLCSDQDGNLYLASSNFRFLDPKGTVYILSPDNNGLHFKAAPYFNDIGLANGLYFDTLQQRIYFSNTIGGIFSFVPGDSVYRAEYLKVRFMEACDDLCTDEGGNIWMSDPGYSTVKMFNPGTGRLVRFIIQGIGQTSSCRIREEEGKEILYLTELKREQKPTSSTFDGRGVLRIPAGELLKLVGNPSR